VREPLAKNGAQGFERRQNAEPAAVLYHPRGSAGEVRSMLCLLERLAHFEHLKYQISDLKSLAESISRQLRAWADSLQNSPITGQRYLNEKTRHVEEQTKRAETFLAKLKQTQRRGVRRDPSTSPP